MSLAGETFLVDRLGSQKVQGSKGSWSLCSRGACELLALALMLEDLGRFLRLKKSRIGAPMSPMMSMFITVVVFSPGE